MNCFKFYIGDYVEQLYILYGYWRCKGGWKSGCRNGENELCGGVIQRGKLIKYRWIYCYI